jgi:predicted transposase/invertase (TIGR01784 family)
MRRDSIFYRLFAQSPQMLFQLLEQYPVDADRYRFDSVSVKEPTFAIDGVFLPPEGEGPGVVYFVEVQFQKDERLYERLFSEAFLYFYRNRERFTDWQSVVIYPNRATQQRDIYPYEGLLNSPRVHRIYLDELGHIQTLPFEVALMVLTTLDDRQAPEQSKVLVQRCQQSGLPDPNQRAIIDMVTTILVYKFTQLSRQEVRAMLGLTEVTLQNTRFYQEVKDEGRQEGLQEGRQEGRQEGHQEGVRLGLRSLLTLQLDQKFKPLSSSLQAAIDLLSLSQLESLALALLDFSERSQFEAWLAPAVGEALVRTLTERLGALPETVVSALRVSSSTPDPTRLSARTVALLNRLEGFDTIEAVQDWLENH